MCEGEHKIFVFQFKSYIQVSNLGTWSNAVIYTSLLPSCLFLPSILIKKLKVKWTLVVCIFSYSTYIAAQFYPEFYTLLPTAFILGMGAAPMWSAKCTYLTQVAHRFAGLDGVDPEPVVVKFFGIFFFFFQCNSIIGSLISTTGKGLFKFSANGQGGEDAPMLTLNQNGREINNQ